MSEMGKNYEKATETRARVCGISILSAPDSKNKDDFSASVPTLFADPFACFLTSWPSTPIQEKCYKAIGIS